MLYSYVKYFGYNRSNNHSQHFDNDLNNVLLQRQYDFLYNDIIVRYSKNYRAIPTKKEAVR